MIVAQASSQRESVPAGSRYHAWLRQDHSSCFQPEKTTGGWNLVPRIFEDMDDQDPDIFFDVHADMWKTVRYLPNWRQEGELNFVMWRRAGASALT